MTTPPALSVDVKAQIGAFDLSVDFTVSSGLAVLFGPSGSGKSLTLSLIAGLRRPSAGVIRIGERVVSDPANRVHVSPQDRRIGMVFQDGLLLPHRSVVSNVAVAVRSNVSKSDRREIAMKWLESVGAQALADRRPMSLSGGQRQRVALARGLAGDPSLLLLDEPLSSLDAAVRAELGELIRQVIVTSGVPSLMVTHDDVEAQALADTIIEFDNGRTSSTRAVVRDLNNESEASE